MNLKMQENLYEKPIYLLNIIDTNTVGLDGPDKKIRWRT